MIPEGSTQALTVRLAEEHGKMKAKQFNTHSPMSMNVMPGMNHMNGLNYNNYSSSSAMQRGRARVRFPNVRPY